MRRTWGRRVRGELARARNSISFEQLEDRLTLSHGPLPVAYDTANFGPVEPGLNVPPGSDFKDARPDAHAFRAPDIDAHDYRSFAAPAGMSYGENLGSPARLPADVRVNQPQYEVAPIQAIPIFQPVVVVIVNGSIVGFLQPGPDRVDISMHAEANGSAIAPAINAVAGRHDDSAVTANVAVGARAGLPAFSAIAASPSASATQGTVGSGAAGNLAAALNSIMPHQVAAPMIAQNGVGNQLLGPVPTDLGTVQLPDAQRESDVRGNNGAAAPAPNVEQSASFMTGASRSENDSSEEQLSIADTSDNRASLLAGMGLNIEAIDRAVETVVDEVEQLGGELAMWLDACSTPSWTSSAIAIVAVGAGSTYLWRGRVRRSLKEEHEEESSSWLFSRLQSPVGHV